MAGNNDFVPREKRKTTAPRKHLGYTMTKKVIFDEKQKDSFSFLCGGKTSDYSGQTITGEITDIDGTAVTMQLGELSAGGMPSHDVSDSSDSGQTPPDKPDGETQSGNSSSQDHASSDSSQPPAKPNSRSGSTDSQPPEMPSGQDSSSNSQSGDSGSQPPEKPDGEAPSGSAPAAWAAAALPRARRV